MYNTSLDTLKQMGDVVKSLYDKVSSHPVTRPKLTGRQHNWLRSLMCIMHYITP